MQYYIEMTQFYLQTIYSKPDHKHSYSQEEVV